jgi:hypothetical protein
MRQLGSVSLALCALVLVSTHGSVAQPQAVQDRQQQTPVSNAEKITASAPTNISAQNTAAVPQNSITPRIEQAANPTQIVEIVSLPINRAAYLSVGVNATIGIAALLTLLSVKRQSKASEQTARAAISSAEAVLNGERAWIQIKPYPCAAETRLSFPPNSTTRRASPLNIVNVGRTPARIMSISGSYLVMHRLSELPTRPEYEQRDDFRGMILTPQESIGHLIESLEPSEILVDDLLKKKFVVYVHAKVIYEDVYGNEHETCEGFHLDPESPLLAGKPRLVKAGPPAYHASS